MQKTVLLGKKRGMLSQGCCCEGVGVNAARRDNSCWDTHGGYKQGWNSNV